MSEEEVEMGSGAAGAPGGGRKAAAAAVGDAGMADEISRILGKFDRYKKPQDPVMKKRKSKFVEAVEAEKEQRKALSQKVSEKRRQRAKDLLIPTVSLDQNERALRKIATKGVVMLFNAISAHQKKLVAEEEAAEEERQAAKESRRRVNTAKLAEARGKLSADGQKKNFMQALTEKREALKKSEGGGGAAAGADVPEGGTKKKARQGAEGGRGGWKVLQDDLLVGSSLKDWDKDNSDSDDDDDANAE